MLHEYAILKFLWAEIVNTICHVINQVSLCLIIKKIPYELWIDRSLIYHILKCSILNILF
jgi:hypothetical protein